MGRNEFTCDCNIIHKESVEAALVKMPGEDIFNGLADFFALMGNTTRAKILYAIAEHEMCVCDLANVLNMSKSSVSHQLGLLRISGIVRARKSGKEVYYSLDDDHVKEVFEVGLSHIEHKNGGKR